MVTGVQTWLFRSLRIDGFSVHDRFLSIFDRGTGRRIVMRYTADVSAGVIHQRQCLRFADAALDDAHHLALFVEHRPRRIARNLQTLGDVAYLQVLY